jgi:hypothetical protein
MPFSQITFYLAIDRRAEREALPTSARRNGRQLPPAPVTDVINMLRG